MRTSNTGNYNANCIQILTKISKIQNVDKKNKKLLQIITTLSAWAQKE